ncbi:MAG TPA: tetratricopeptide repeat protein [Acidobacteriaceae bacterium]|nr:tetratricopeptide repeat protein [Acidobacteriaceae bacterium]
MKSRAFLIWLLPCVVAMGVLTASAQVSTVPQIAQMLRTQQYEQALSNTNALLQKQPRDCRLLSLRGMALNGLARSSEALQAFRQALQSCPDDLLPLEGAAQIEYARRQPDAANLLTRILAIRPDDVTSHAMLATVDRARRDCQAALPHYKASRSLFGVRPEMAQGYASCLASTGDYSHAAEEYRQLLLTHPDATSRYNLAIVLWKMQEPRQALAALEPLLTPPTDETALVLGSQIAEEAGDTPHAVQLLRLAIVLDPKRTDNYLNFAEIAFNHSSAAVGIDMLNFGIVHLPNAASLYVARGVLEVQISKTENAIADFERAHRLKPQLSLATDAVGIMKSQQHEFAASVELFRQQAQQHPKDSLLWYLYAEALSQSTKGGPRSPEALAAAERSVALDGNYVPARDLLALLYLQASQPQRALEASLAALKIDPDDETALYREIIARRTLGQHDEAQQLVPRLQEIRNKNMKRQQLSHSYVLRDEMAQPEEDGAKKPRGQ